MLIEPASNVSVPLTVVIRTRSNVPDRANEPAENYPNAPSLRHNDPDSVQALVLELSKVNTIKP